MLHVTKLLKYEHLKEPFLNSTLHAASVGGPTWARLCVTSLKEPSCMVRSSMYTHYKNGESLCSAWLLNTLRDRASLHKFPGDPKLREKRVKQDRMTRNLSCRRFN